MSLHPIFREFPETEESKPAVLHKLLVPHQQSHNFIIKIIINQRSIGNQQAFIIFRPHSVVEGIFARKFPAT